VGDDGLLELFRAQVREAEGVERRGMAVLVAGLLEEGGGVGVGGDGLVEALRLLQGEAEVVERLGLAVLVADSPVESGGVGVGADGPVQLARVLQYEAEAVQHLALAVLVVGPGHRPAPLAIRAWPASRPAWHIWDKRTPLTKASQYPQLPRFPFS
jgi:hypothetical protein